MCKVMGGYLNFVSFAEYTGHLMPAPNGPCDIVLLDFLTVTYCYSGISIIAECIFYIMMSLQENTHTQKGTTECDGSKLKT
jgi:hypothetical protein